jgi:hypothetical protein
MTGEPVRIPPHHAETEDTMLSSFKSSTPMCRWTLAIVSALLALGIGLPGYAEEEANDCRLTEMMLVAAEGGTDTPADSGTIEERAVPRMSPGRPPMPALKGAVMEGNRLRALPGYALDVQQDGSSFLMRPAGGGAGATGRCNCFLVGAGGGGTCSAKRDGRDGVKCVANGCDKCSIIIDNAAFGGGLKGIQ